MLSRSSQTFTLEWKLSSLGLLAGLSKMFAESSVFSDISFCLQSLTSTFLPVCGSHLKEYTWVRDTLQPMCVTHLRETFRKSRIPRSVVDGDS